MLNEKMKKVSEENKGELPYNTMLGLYPLFYVDDQGNTLCPECANKHEEYNGTIIDYDVNWEDPDLFCDDCGNRIESLIERMFI